MKNIKIFGILLIIAASCLSISSCNSDDTDTENTGTPSTGSGSSGTFGPWFGVNMSGGEFAAVYPGIDGTHYGYPDKSDIAYFADKGFKLIRFPFRWERIQHEMNGELDNNEIEKMKSVMDAAKELGVNVILDMHNFGRYCYYSNGINSELNTYAILGTRICSIEHFCDVWVKLAQTFKDYSNLCGYEIMNEPYDMLTTTPWDTIAQHCINAIRTVDIKTPIVVDGNQYASASKWKNLSDGLKNLKDPSNNLVFSAHVYFDNDASGTYDGTYDEEGTNEQTGVERLRPFVEWCRENGKTGFVGEYSVPDDDPRWLVTLDNALAFLAANGIGGTYWSAGHRWGDVSYAIQPIGGQDRPQMAIVGKYIMAE